MGEPSVGAASCESSPSPTPAICPPPPRVFRMSGFVFFSDFDSGNIGTVELAGEKDAEFETGFAKLNVSSSSDSSKSRRRSRVTGGDASTAPIPTSSGPSSAPTDHHFLLRTRPDCMGTTFENGNRTWFFFGIARDPALPKPVSSTALVRFTVKNLNKQSKLFSQGMVPIVMTAPLSKGQLRPPPVTQQYWERIRERPTYKTEDNQFCISFRVKLDSKQITYIAFTYPYTYKELQVYLNKLDKKYSTKSLEYDDLKGRPATSIYYHRENACYSLEGKRVDLLTVTATNGMLPEREAKLENLFPDEGEERPHKFSNKKIVFISARVHPGETQSSFVINGFIKFVLRETDPRAMALRRRYIFKLIPMLNPDGVIHGHYRTDVRGVNLNRVYANPSFAFHPQIYAARKLILYANYGYEVQEEKLNESCKSQPNINLVGKSPEDKNTETARWLRSSQVQGDNERLMDSLSKKKIFPMGPPSDPALPSCSSGWYEMTETSRFSEGDESIADFSSVHSYGSGGANKGEPLKLPKSPSQQHHRPLNFAEAFSGKLSANRQLSFDSHSSEANKSSPALSQQACLASSSSASSLLISENANLQFVSQPKEQGKSEQDAVSSTDSSGLYLYVDIHGHASKRGIFMYGNHFKDMDTKVESMLLPKLMSINCANFDFPACNFTERNMYMKDRHTGAGKEGSGRVSVFKCAGTINSFTLECNFNTGRVVNSVPLASRDSGRATPPPNYDLPPKYDPAIYEDAGKAMAISILDLTESNPWSRIVNSSCKNLRGVRDAIKKYIKQNEEQAKRKAQLNANNSMSPTARRTRRSRTFSSSSQQGLPVKVVSSKAAKLTSPTMKSPVSPDAYRPVTKIPRKAAKNSQDSGKNGSESEEKLVTRRSKSIPGSVESSSVSSFLPYLQKSLQTRPRSKKTSLQKSRSTPTSRPVSRPVSPINRGAQGVKKTGVTKKKKKAVDPLAASGSRKASDASTSSLTEVFNSDGGGGKVTKKTKKRLVR